MRCIGCVSGGWRGRILICEDEKGVEILKHAKSPI